MVAGGSGAADATVWSTSLNTRGRRSARQPRCTSCETGSGSDCYQAALARTPGLTGTLTVQVRLEGAAGVGIVADEPEVRDDPAAPLGDAALAACVGVAAASLELPMPAEDVAVVVSYPYQLAP